MIAPGFMVLLSVAVLYALTDWLPSVGMIAAAGYAFAGRESFALFAFALMKWLCDGI